MIRTEQLTPDTLMLHVHGQLNPSQAKELSLTVCRSYHLGFKKFLCNLSQVAFLDDLAIRHLTMIGEGLRKQGRVWRVISPPTSFGDELILRTTLQHLPSDTWN